MRPQGRPVLLVIAQGSLISPTTGERAMAQVLLSPFLLSAALLSCVEVHRSLGCETTSMTVPANDNPWVWGDRQYLLWPEKKGQQSYCTILLQVLLVLTDSLFSCPKPQQLLISTWGTWSHENRACPWCLRKNGFQLFIKGSFAFLNWLTQKAPDESISPKVEVSCPNNAPS